MSPVPRVLDIPIVSPFSPVVSVDFGGVYVALAHPQVPSAAWPGSAHGHPGAAGDQPPVDRMGCDGTGDLGGTPTGCRCLGWTLVLFERIRMYINDYYVYSMDNKESNFLQDLI